jgi:hypothetical protein
VRQLAGRALLHSLRTRKVTDALLAIDASGVFDEPVAPYVLFGIKT